jgi:hypothetical protein
MAKTLVSLHGGAGRPGGHCRRWDMAWGKLRGSTGRVPDAVVLRCLRGGWAFWAAAAEGGGWQVRVDKLLFRRGILEQQLRSWSSSKSRCLSRWDDREHWISRPSTTDLQPATNPRDGRGGRHESSPALIVEKTRLLADFDKPKLNELGSLTKS